MLVVLISMKSLCDERQHVLYVGNLDKPFPLKGGHRLNFLNLLESTGAKDSEEIPVDDIRLFHATRVNCNVWGI